MIICNAKQHLKEDVLIFSRYFIFFLSLFSFSIISFQTLMHKAHGVYNPYHISYTSSFCYVMYCIVSEKCICRHFLEDCFDCYSLKIISAVANNYLIPYKLLKRAPETQSLQLCSSELRHKSKKYKIWNKVFRTKDFVSHKYKQ